MANPKHLAILRKGVGTWNQWRQEHPEIKEPDLEGAYLGGMILKGANLWGANLIVANLSGANLNRANLKGVHLVGAELEETHLEGTYLEWAFLDGTNLQGAVLNKAQLAGANFNGAYLAEANFTGAFLDGTKFIGVDLSNVLGLLEAVHLGPSTIDIETIYRSNGKIPNPFLRGCGVPDDLIEYIHSIAGAIQFYSCFISYNHQDEEFTKRIHADLQDRGVRCWYAPEDLKIGDRFRDTIEESIRIHDKLLIVLSEHSLSSDWVEQEVLAAMDKEKDVGKPVLFPIRLDDSPMESTASWTADIRRTRQIGDFTNWKDLDSYQQALDRLIHDLRSNELPSAG